MFANLTPALSMVKQIRTDYDYVGTMSRPFGSPSQETMDSVTIVKNLLDNFLAELMHLRGKIMYLLIWISGLVHACK